MHSFITLMNEDQLSIPEQRQVYVSIKQDYERLLKDYSVTKQQKGDTSITQPNNLDLDV